MKTAAGIQKQIEEMQVERSNFYRYKIPEVFEFALKSLPHIDAMTFFRISFGLSLTSLAEFFRRYEKESFTEIMDDFNIRGLLHEK